MTSSLAESLGAGHTSAGWARDFLKGIGAPTTPANVAFIQRWETLESGGGGGRYNPLNSVLGAPGATSVNSVGVKNYTSYQQGLNASVSTFTQTQWAGVVNGLRANNQQAAQSAINAEYATWHGGPINILGGNVTDVSGVNGTNAELTADRGGDSLTAGDDDCLISLPGAKIGFGVIGPKVGGGCLLHRSGGRALLGGVAVVAGGIIMLAGAGFVAIGTKPGREISSAAVLGATAGAAA